MLSSLSFIETLIFFPWKNYEEKNKIFSMHFFQCFKLRRCFRDVEMQENACHACYTYLDTYDAPMHSKEKQASPVFVKHIHFLSEAIRKQACPAYFKHVC